MRWRRVSLSLTLSFDLSPRDGTSVDSAEESYSGGDRPLGDRVEESYAAEERLLIVPFESMGVGCEPELLRSRSDLSDHAESR